MERRTQTPAQKMGLKPGSRIATTVEFYFGSAGTLGTLIEDDGTDRPYFEMDAETGLTLSGIRDGYARCLFLSDIRPLTPGELAEETRVKEPEGALAAPDPRDARIAELEKLVLEIMCEEVAWTGNGEYEKRLDAIMGRE